MPEAFASGGDESPGYCPIFSGLQWQGRSGSQLADCRHTERVRADALGLAGSTEGYTGGSASPKIVTEQRVLAETEECSSPMTRTCYHRALSFSNYGWIPDGVRYDHFMVASNYRMPELTAALLMGQLPHKECRVQSRAAPPNCRRRMQRFV